MTHPRRVSEMVREMVPFMRNRLTADEHTLAVHLRNNHGFYEALTRVVGERIEGRAKRPVPSDPVACLASMACDRELRWLLSRLELVYRSPVIDPVEARGEQPA